MEKWKHLPKPLPVRPSLSPYFSKTRPWISGHLENTPLHTSFSTPFPTLPTAPLQTPVQTPPAVWRPRPCSIPSITCRVPAFHNPLIPPDPAPRPLELGGPEAPALAVRLAGGAKDPLLSPGRGLSAAPPEIRRSFVCLLTSKHTLQLSHTCRTLFS